jgi:hypothetical protein
MQKLAPAETLVYLETEDLSKTLSAITQNKTFIQLTQSNADFSTLRHTQLAIAITGFEANETNLTDEAAVLSFRPHFVGIADTHSLETTNYSLIENGVAGFITKIFGEEAKQTVAEENGSRIYSWVSNDSRKFFAAAKDSVIYVGNDRDVLIKCLEIKNGAGESLIGNENLSRLRARAQGTNAIALGYISPEGLEQIAGFLGVKVAVDASDDSDIRTFISRVLPSIVKKTIRETSWIATSREGTIEDEIEFALEQNSAAVFDETLAPESGSELNFPDFVPKEVESLTVYRLKNSQLAFRSVVLSTAQNLDAVGGAIIAKFSRAALEPYGIPDAETFLSATESEATIIRLDEEGDNAAIVAKLKDTTDTAKLLASMGFKSDTSTEGDFSSWKKADEFSALILEKRIVIGNKDAVAKCLAAFQNEELRSKDFRGRKNSEEAAIISYAKDSETAAALAELIGEPKDPPQSAASWTVSETSFDRGGINRRTSSDFGVVGEILSLLTEEK